MSTTKCKRQGDTNKLVLKTSKKYILVCFFLHCFRYNKLSRNCKKEQQASVVEIGMQPQENMDRPAPALPPCRLTSHHIRPPEVDPIDSTTQYTGIYSHPYQHMGQRIMAFFNLQRRRMHTPQVRRPLSYPTSLPSLDASASTQLLTMDVRRQSQEMSHHLEPISDYLEPVTNNDRQNGMGETRSRVYERIDETHMAVQSVLQDESQEVHSYSDSDYLNPVGTHDSQYGPVYEEIEDSELETIV